MDLASKKLFKRTLKSAAVNLAIVLCMAAFIMLVISNLKLSMYSVVGESMEPALHDTSTIVLRESSEFKRGQLVFFNKPLSWQDPTVDRETKLLVKRIKATSGDLLEFDGKRFSINGKLFLEMDAAYGCKASKPYRHTLGPGELFVAGDNRYHSIDSLRRFCDGDSDFLISEKRVKAHGDPLLVF